jgi:hypothetical protein
MKLLLTLLSCFISGFCFSQTVNDYQVTLNGIGPFKLDMKKTEVEKILNQAVQTPHGSKKEDYLNDTVSVTYKEAEITLVFYKKYIDETKNEIAIYSISGKSPLLKTKSGIVAGDDKMKIISTYSEYNMNIYRAYELNEKGNYIPSKTKWIIQLMGENSPGTIEFKLENNKLIEFTVGIFEGC